MTPDAGTDGMNLNSMCIAFCLASSLFSTCPLQGARFRQHRAGRLAVTL